jgi:hypothetical protein
MAEEEKKFGVFNDSFNLNLDTEDDDKSGVDPIPYNVYQVQSQTPTLSDQDIQRLYGTQAMPVFEWAKKIQTGQRTYDPSDSFDEDMMEKYKKFGQLPPGYISPQEIIAQKALQGTAGQIGMSVGTSIGAEIANPYATGDTLSRIGSGIMKTGQDTAIESVNLARFSELGDKTKDVLRASGLADNYLPELSSRSAAEATGNLAQFDRGLETGTLLETSKGSGTYVPTDNFGKARNFAYGDEATGFPEGFDATLDSKDALAPLNTVTEASRLGTVTDRLNPFTDAGAQNVTASGVGAGVNFMARVASGQDVDDAAKSAADAGLVQYATTALLAATPLAPFSTIIGGIVGGFVGRVICNELMRQGIMDRKQVILDYKFTRDYLTPTHVSGYHVWAVWMVKQMRKGKFVKLWAHIAGHRANEIAYIYGERDKPDYLGKIYRKILEPICWTIGTFCKETDWSILYRKKEI